MQAPSIRAGGADPGSDGDVNLYISPEGTGESWFSPGRRVIFVNGMDNSPSDHATSARALSLLQACPVIGVYNRTDGFWLDLGQCITDKATLGGVPMGMGFTGWQTTVDALFAIARRVRPGLDKRDFVGTLIQTNNATYALYRLLVGDGGPGRGVPIFCHSQGNLITSNALTAVALALGLPAIAGMEIHSFGSPCRFWPDGIRRVNNAFTFDPVSWLDLTMDLTSSKVGFIAAHGFEIYMQNDAEFVVNRFRWGSFGTTVMMDEEGLAEFCISLGNNPRRLRGIFTRLEEAHYEDSDDVAYKYCELASNALLRSIKASDPQFIRQLIRILDTGITTWAEEEQVMRLRTL